MEQQEIIEGNKLIAEFMGGTIEVPLWEKNMGNDLKWWQIPNGLNGPVIFWVVPENGLEYRTNWQWLMPVVEKIESNWPNDEVYFNVGIEADGCKIFRFEDGAHDLDFNIHHFETGSKIESAWQAVVDFIKWYNGQLTFGS